MADFMEVVNLRDEARNLKGLSDCDKLFQYAQELWEESKSDGERYAAITGLEAAMFHGDAPQSEAASIICHVLSQFILIFLQPSSLIKNEPVSDLVPLQCYRFFSKYIYDFGPDQILAFFQ